MKRILFIILVMLSAAARAQQITVIAVDGEPLDNASVTDGTRIVYTQETGMADISIFKGSDLTISKEGYYTVVYTWEQLSRQKFTVRLMPNTFEIDEVIVSANRWEQPTSDVPASIIPVNLGNLTMEAPQTAADLLGTTGNVFIQKSQLGGGSPMIRGFAANRVLIVVDGVRMNNAIYRSGNLQNVINIDPYSIRENEIVLGPASNIYGSDAIGGVMDFHTKNPYLSTSDEAVVSGSFNSAVWSADMAYSAHVDINVGFSRVAFLTGFTHSSFSDMKMGSYGPEEYLRPYYQVRINDRDTLIANKDPRIQSSSGYSQTYFMQKVRLRPTDNTIITYGFHWSSTSDVPRYDRLIQTTDEGLKYAQWYYGPQKWIMHNLQVTSFAENFIYDKLRLIIAAQDYSESRHDRKFGKTDLRERYENVKVYSLNMDLTKVLSRKTSVFYGVEGVYNYVLSRGELTDITTGKTEAYPSRYPSGATYQTFAIYSQFKTRLNSKFVLDYGARYTNVGLYAPFDNTFYNFPFTEARLNKSAPSASAGMVYSLNDALKYKLNFSTGFRAPNIDDIGKVFDSEPGKVIVPNPDLEPEYIYSAETGIHFHGQSVLFDFTVFYSYLDNAMVRSDFLFNGQDSILYDGVMSAVQALVNADYAVVYGVEATFAVSAGRFVTWKTTGVWSKGHDSQNEPLRHVPPAFGSTYLVFNNQKGLRSELYIIYNGEIPYSRLAPSEKDKPHLYAMDQDGNPYCPSWWTLNFSIKYAFDEFVISSGIKNILDKRYRPYSSGIAGSGRNLFLTVGYHF